MLYADLVPPWPKADESPAPEASWIPHRSESRFLALAQDSFFSDSVWLDRGRLFSNTRGIFLFSCVC